MTDIDLEERDMRSVRCVGRKRNLRSIQGPKFFRTISLVIRQDYMRERMLNIVADAVKRVVPKEMLKERMLKFKITL